MGKKAYLDITESISELQKILVKQQSLKGEKRVRCLIEIKSAKFGTRQELADYLGFISGLWKDGLTIINLVAL